MVKIALARALLVSALATSLVLPVPEVRAAGSLGVSPTDITASLASRSVSTYVLTVTNDVSISVEAAGLGQIPDGPWFAVPVGEDTSPFTARPWISVDPGQMSAGSGNVTVTVVVPQGTPPGERYGAVYLHSSGDSMVGIVVPVMLTVDESSFEPVASGNITQLTMGSAFELKPTTFSVTFSNTGNSGIRDGRSSLVVQNAAGNTVAWQQEGPIMPYPWIIPGYPRTVVTTYQTGFASGDYNLIATVTLSDGSFLDAETMPFTVAAHPAWDINGDHLCNVLDLILVGNKVGQHGPAGWLDEDTSGDGAVNVLDVIFVGNHIGETW